MPSKLRETHIVNAVSCPRCHARVGQACYIGGVSRMVAVGTGVKPACHPERRKAHQEQRAKEGK